MRNDEILEKIQKIAEEEGFDLVGIAEIACSNNYSVGRVSSNCLLAMTNENDKLDEWIKNGYCADMKWFADSADKRKDILKVMPEAKSMICVAMNYFSDTNILMQANDTNNTNKKNAIGKIARYAYGRDYHKIFDGKLKLFSQKLKEIFPEGNFRYYSDTGPVLERAWAARAGLGFVGKNTNLITKYGSWVLLGEIIANIATSDQQLAVSRSKANTHLSTCGSCRRCLDACPTGALIAPYTVDARKCISYLTIEHKGEIPMELREKIGNRIFGCDACQEVCPFNIGRQTEGVNFKTAQSDTDENSENKSNEDGRGMIARQRIDLKEILSIKTDEEFLQKFAGSPLMRAKRRGLVRNACIAAGNSGDKSLLSYLKECLNDKEPIIASHAKWAIEKIEARK